MSYIFTWTDLILEQAPLFYYLTAIIGAISLLPYLFTPILGIYRLVRKRANLIKKYGEGSWALITGSSDGIGKELAIQLAGEGFNIVLLARTQSKLKEVKEMIKLNHPNILVEIVLADLVKEGKKDKLKDVLPELSKYDISLVVNNAGVDLLENYLNLPLNSIIDLISINCFAVSALTYTFLHRFQERLKITGKRSLILNVSSMAAELPLSYLNIYSASKAYVDRLTRNAALEHPEVEWMVLRPSEVSTAMTFNRKPDLMTITAAKCASGTLNDMSHDIETNGHINHKIQSFLNSLIPRPIFYFIWCKFLVKEFLEERKNHQKKLQSEKK